MTPKPNPAGAPGTTRAIWLLILRGGGHWTTREVAAALPDFPDPSSTMMSMAKLGSLKAEGAQPRKFKVTADCRIPHGITLRDLLDSQIGITSREQKKAAKP